MSSISNYISSQIKGSSFGELVDAYAKGRKQTSDAIYDLLIQHVGKDCSVLDIGCGTGISTQLLFENFREVRGVDHDSKMLAVARKIEGHQEAFDEASVYQLPFPNEKFDLATMFSSFHWFCDKMAITEISRVLNKKGFVYVVHGGSGRPLKNEVEKIMESVLGYQVTSPKEDYEPQMILQENGFTILIEENIEVENNYTVEEALQRVQSSSSWNDVKKAGKEKEMVTQLEELFHQQADSNGMISTLKKTKVLLAQKNS